MITTLKKLSDIKAPSCLICNCSHQLKFMVKVGYQFFRCQGCGLEYIYPQPTDKELEDIYGEHYYGAWGLETKVTTTEQMKQATFARILGLISDALPSGAKILDLGCASGYFLSVAQERGF